MNDDAAISKAYHLLSALKKNLPDFPYVMETWVHDYHAIIDSIQDSLDLKEFRVPDDHLVHLDQNPAEAEILSRYRDQDYEPDSTSERFIGRLTFLTKLDAALSYFEELRKTGRSS